MADCPDQGDFLRDSKRTMAKLITRSMAQGTYTGEDQAVRVASIMAEADRLTAVMKARPRPPRLKDVLVSADDASQEPQNG